MTKQSTAVAAKSHAALGASNAHRWMACPGSVRLSQGIPEPPDNEHSRRGTAAHAVAELALGKNVSPSIYLGTTVEQVEIDDDIVAGVTTYVEHCRALMARPGTQYWIEEQVSCAPLNPPAPMFGTCDFVAYDPRTRVLDVVDYKNGSGVVVEAKGNAQLRYYAIGAALQHTDLPIDQVNITVIQPNAFHKDGPVRTETLGLTDLLEWSMVLLRKARETQSPEAPLVVGDHCRWCRAAHVCPAQADHAAEVARIDFADPGHEVMPPAPESLPHAVFEDILAKLPIVEAWIKTMYAHAENLLRQGDPVRGHKMVAKRAVRKWADEATVARHLQEHYGLSQEELHDMKLKSPAQIEKVMGKESFASLPEDYVTKSSSGFSLVPESDPRPAVALDPASDFGALPPAEPEQQKKRGKKTRTAK